MLLRLPREQQRIFRVAGFRLHVKQCLVATGKLSADPIESAKQCATTNNQILGDLYLPFDLIATSVRKC